MGFTGLFLLLNCGGRKKRHYIRSPYNYHKPSEIELTFRRDIAAIQIYTTGTVNGGMLHVDYKGNTQGDHWVLLTEKAASGDYIAIDPAYGKEITFTKNPPSGTAINSVILYGKTQTNAKNAGSYKAVRFVTLTAA